MFPNSPALDAEGQTLTYRCLHARAASIAATLQRFDSTDGPRLTAVFAHRSVTAYAGILAALFQGHGYVPLNPTFPTDRSRTMLAVSRCASLIVDSSGASQLNELLRGIAHRITVLLPDHDDVSGFSAAWPQHLFLGAKDLTSADQWSPSEVAPDDIAYLLFTSGSSGTPKGVMVSHRNVISFVHAMVGRYGINESDRLSQLFEMTFDLSAFDMFVAWERGACVCCASTKQKLLPGNFIREARLTVWFSVPSTGILLKKLRLLEPGMYPDLRISLFCGEAMPAELATAWAKAAPNSIVENLYGPTELTIACTLYRWDERTSPAQCEHGLVPIGESYPGMTALVVDESLHEVPPGNTGELIMSGPQVALGYWEDPGKTAAAFVIPPGADTTFYRTGDKVRRPHDGAPLIYLGRIDNQIKIRGHRVELGEIEAAIRDAAGVETAIALGWPLTDTGADGIVGFMPPAGMDTTAVIERIKQRLPGYMVPRDLHEIARFPLNSNGKVDRKALAQMLANGIQQEIHRMAP